MWYLLVAAGAGYLAQRWQNSHKSRPLLPGKCHRKPNPPNSAPATPETSSSSLSGTNELDTVNNANTGPNGSIDKEDTSIDGKAPLFCFVSGNEEENLSHQQCNSSYPQVVKSNKRSAGEAFLVQVADTFEATRANENDESAHIAGPNLVFANGKQNTRDQFVSNSRQSSESSTTEWITKSQSMSTSKPSLGFTNIQGNAKDQVVYTSKFDLDSDNIDNKEQLQGDSTSPSSCCSSSSTVLNSPIGRKSVLQKRGSFQFRGKEQRTEINIHAQLNTLQNHVAGSSSPSFRDKGALKGSGQGVASSVSNYDCSQARYLESLQGTSPWECEERLQNCVVGDSRSNLNAVSSFNAPVFTDDKELLATSMRRPYVFRGKIQRGISRTEKSSNELMCNHKVKLEMNKKQGTLSAAGDTISSLVSPSHRVDLNAITSYNAPVFTDDKELLATSTQRPYVFTGENQRGISRTENSTNELMCSDKVKLDMKQKQSTLSAAGDTSSSLVSPSHSVAKNSACEAESESLVSFGLAVAVCFMVSSSKKEMKNMGKVLKETEDLVSDMRKELEERRTQLCGVTSLTSTNDGCNEKLLTFKSKDAATQVGKVDMHMDSVCQVGFSDDESIKSVVTEEHAQYGFRMDFNTGHEDKPHFVETSVEGHLDNYNQNEECNSEDEEDSSTQEETGEDDYVLSLLELERKLWKVFQERQEEKILELEAALERALSKLQEKEEELQWWKNRAAWLMEHSVGSTSGAVSVKTRIGRVEERFNHASASSFSIKRGNVSENISHKFLVCDASTREFSARETNHLELEEECIEIVGNLDGPKNREGHQNQVVRVGSDCSICSSEESVLSVDVKTFRYPNYTN